MPTDSNIMKSGNITEHVVKNIDAAISNEWIKVYYQPVIRSLTEKLCGAESLARWVDPELGFLSPDKFITALEDSKQICKLDSFIVERVCRDIAERLSEGLPTVPVSVNFSRLDFETGDMLKLVEDNVRKYDIPRDYLHIEITESMIASDAELMNNVIESFRGAGYEVWMDDFGSGYSSLTLLKDYHFDTLKLDMNFLSNLNDRSKAIITSTITMSKDIGIKTLAEGVEEKEQVDFLKSIGCGKLQGYFYGKPMPVADLFEHMAERGYEIEERQWRHYYDSASFAAKNTDEPLEIVEDDGSEFNTLFMNEPYKKQIFKENVTADEADRYIYHTGSPLLKKYREFANKMEKTRNVENFYYTNDGDILRFRGQVLDEHAGRYLIKGSIWNISTDGNITKRNSLDFRLKELNHFYEMVLQINPSTNKATPLLGGYAYGMEEYVNNTDLRFRMARFAEEIVVPEDRNRFEKFLELDTLRERIENEKRGFLEHIYRIKQPDGSYQWRIIAIMMIPGTGGKEYLFCIKSTSDSAMATLKEIFGSHLIREKRNNDDFYGQMFDNFLEHSSVMFFWKDADRKYLGASRSFLEYFHIDKLEDLIGKTGDEYSWTLDSAEYVEREMEVLKKGKAFRNITGQCIIGGVVHNIMFNKAPLYKNDKVAGIMGYVIDVDDELWRLGEMSGGGRIDKITGVMNAKGFVDCNLDYAGQYNEYGRNYGMIIVRGVNHDRIVETYGRQFGDKLLKLVADTIVATTGQTCVVSRTKEEYFALMTYINEKSELDYIADQIKKNVESIRTLDGNDVTIRVKVATRLRSEEGTTDENMYQFLLSEV